MKPKNQVEYRPVNKIKELPGNPRTINKDQFEKLKASISANADYFEARPCILSDRTGELVVIAGNQRLKAAKALKMAEIPTVLLPNLTEEREKEIIIRDNVENGDWDMDILANEWDVEALDEWGVDVPKPKTYEDGALGRDFIMTPLSVLDATKPTWMARKKMWKTLFDSAKGRGDGLLGYSNLVGAAGNTSIFDPVLCEMMYRWFCPNGGAIFDPFCGGCVRGIVAGAMGHRYYGNDLRQEQIDENEAQFKSASEMIEIKKPKWSVGDSSDMDGVMSNYDVKEFDMIFSCPPYADLEVYSDDPNDLSNMDYNEFLNTYENIIAESVSHVKKDRFAVWVVGEIRGKDGSFRHFVEDSIKAFEKAGMKYYNHAVLISGAFGGGLRVRGNMRSRKLVHAHQDVLVFKNGETPEGLDSISSQEIIDEFDKLREMPDYYDDVLVFSNSDSLKELKESFPEIGGKK